jgi:hypothetical protein
MPGRHHHRYSLCLMARSPLPIWSSTIWQLERRGQSMTSSARLSRCWCLRGSHASWRRFRAPSPAGRRPPSTPVRTCLPAALPSPYPPGPQPHVRKRSDTATPRKEGWVEVAAMSRCLCSVGRQRMRGVGVVYYWLSTLVLLRYRFSSAHLTPCVSDDLGSSAGTGNTDASHAHARTYPEPRGSASPPAFSTRPSAPTANYHRPPTTAALSHKTCARAKRRESP